MRNRTGTLELGLLVALFAVTARFVDDLTLYGATALVIVAVAAGTATLLGESLPWRWPFDRVALPVLATFGSLGIVRLVDQGPLLGAAAVASFLVASWVVGLELSGASLAAAVESRPAGPTDWLSEPEFGEARQSMAASRLAAFGLAFLAFTAIGGFVPGGVAGEGQNPGLPGFLAALVLDFAVATLAGLRILALHPHTRNDVFVALYLYLLVVAPAGVLIRVLALPRLFGPALLTLAFYIVTSLRESDEPIRHNRRLLEETAILVAAGLLTVAVGLLVR